MTASNINRRMKRKIRKCKTLVLGFLSPLCIPVSRTRTSPNSQMKPMSVVCLQSERQIPPVFLKSIDPISSLWTPLEHKNTTDRALDPLPPLVRDFAYPWNQRPAESLIIPPTPPSSRLSDASSTSSDPSETSISTQDMPYSDQFSDIGIPMARPSSHRTALSVSTPSGESIILDDDAEVRPQSSATDYYSFSPNTSSEKPCSFSKLQEGSKRFARFVEQDMRSYFRKREGELAASYPGRCKTRLTVQVPSSSSAVTASSTQERATGNGERILDDHNFENSFPFGKDAGIDVAQPDNNLPRDHEANSVEQRCSALLFASEEEACLAAFAHHWYDPDAEPVDHLLFADFDTGLCMGSVSESR
ncbi:hypothetical protein GQ44DRAFT_724582 [Phaeosphaeriaceae sp. PMI808]|nr:hypothetical protein GQ44DRAFT_724582 [Phaeosphaeriaceae sp. PMI808]